MLVKLLCNNSPLTALLILYCDEAADKADFNKLVVVFIYVNLNRVFK